VINFWADAYEIELGQCTILHWELKNVAGAYLSSGKAVEGAGAQDVCPKETATYTLYVKLLDGNAASRSVTIGVTQPPTLIPDTTTPIPSKPTAIPDTPTVMPDTPTAMPDTPTIMPDAPTPELLLTPIYGVPLTVAPQLN
jgi:hypothetical protein